MLEVKDLKLSLGDSSILKGVSFAIAEGETVGIIGPNGSGKTTLFNCLSGFLLPSAGRIIFRGEDITVSKPHQRARCGIGRVFQNAGVFQEMTLLENIITALEGRSSPWASFFPWSAKYRHFVKEAYRLLGEINLEQKALDKAGSLSGGEKRLLEIMRVLSFGADLFLLDEPTAGVSPKMKEDVASLIQRLQILGKTVLIIEHDINFIQKFCNRIIVLDVGAVVLDDLPERVKENPLLQEIYFGNSLPQKRN